MQVRGNGGPKDARNCGIRAYAFWSIVPPAWRKSSGKAGSPLAHAGSLQSALFRVVGTMPVADEGCVSPSVASRQGSVPRGRSPRGNMGDSLPTTDHEFTVIIPAYNEQRRLPKSLEELGQFLDAAQLDYRVIVADDGSTDRTPELAGGFGRRFSTVRLGEKRRQRPRYSHGDARRNGPGRGLHRRRFAVSPKRLARRVTT